MPHHPSCNPLLMPTPASLISSHLLFWKSWIKALGALAYNTATNYFFIFVWQAMENKNITSSSNFHSCWIDFGRWMILTNCSHAATLYIVSSFASFAHWDFTFVLVFFSGRNKKSYNWFAAAKVGSDGEREGDQCQSFFCQFLSPAKCFLCQGPCQCHCQHHCQYHVVSRCLHSRLLKPREI